jgi:DNA-binding CsgD family transcriptional regulator
VLIERGEWDAAQAIFQKTLVFGKQERHVFGMAMALEALAAASGELGDAQRGVRLLGAADRLREHSGCPVPLQLRSRYDLTTMMLRTRLCADTFAESWAAGRQMTLDEAIAYALEPSLSEALALEPTPSPHANLTSREIDVLRLIAAGHTNKEIAAQLFISPGTVATHVVNILSKLGVESRTAAAAWAIHADIVEHPPL